MQPNKLFIPSALPATALFLFCLLSGVYCTLTDQIKELATLRDDGIITESEFAKAKQKLIGTSVYSSIAPPPRQSTPQQPSDAATISNDEEELKVRDEGDTNEVEEEDLPPFVGHYLPLPPSDDRPFNQDCPPDARHVLNGVDEWIQGEESIEAGAATAFFFFSVQDPFSREIAVFLSDLHDRLRHRGFQVVGVHADMGGFAADDYLLDDLEEFIDNVEIHFSVVAAHHKYGVPPLHEDGNSIDLERAADVLVDPDSLWAQLQPDKPYKFPVLIVRRNCGRIIEAGGMQIQEIEKHIEPFYDRFLYPAAKTKRKRLARGKTSDL